MTRLALVNPATLLGHELREALDRQPELWRECLLLTTDEDETGQLTEIGGAPALVKPYSSQELEGVDVAVLCGERADLLPLLEDLPENLSVILLAPDGRPEDGRPIVAGVNLEQAEAAQVLLSPNAAVVGMAHLLHPLQRYGVQRVAATLVQPSSSRGKEGMDEVFEQTRAVLAFAPEPPRAVFPVQMSFNLVPSEQDSEPILRALDQVLGTPGERSLHLLRGGIFHGYGLSLHVQLREHPDPDELRETLGDHPLNDLAPDPELLGPIDSANRSEVLIGAVQAQPGQPGSYGVWAVMDNITCGGALNALAMVEALGTGVAH